MKQGWERATIGEVCTVVNGGTPKTAVAEFWGGAHAWVTPAEMGRRASPYISNTARTLTDAGLKDSSARLLPPKSVILSSRAPIGHLVINCEPMATNQGCKGLVPSAVLEPKFLYYYLAGIVDVLDSLGTGATFKELSAGKLQAVPIPLPPLPDQRRIVAILDEAFEGIDAARTTAEQNRQNARGIFGSRLNSIFAGAYGSEDLTTLASLATDITDGDHMPPPKASEGVPFITIGNVIKETREIDFSSTFKVPRAYFEQLKPNKKPRPGDVLYTVTGSFGIPLRVTTEVEFCFQRHIGLIRPTAETNSSWLYYLMMSPQIVAQANRDATGAAQRTVSLGVLRKFVVPCVPALEQREAAGALDRLAGETKDLEILYSKKLKALDVLKQSLLHHAFAGEL